MTTFLCTSVSAAKKMKCSFDTIIICLNAKPEMFILSSQLYIVKLIPRTCNHIFNHDILKQFLNNYMRITFLSHSVVNVLTQVYFSKFIWQRFIISSDDTELLLFHKTQVTSKLFLFLLNLLIILYTIHNDCFYIGALVRKQCINN